MLANKSIAVKDAHMNIRYIQLKPDHFNAIIALGNYVHGDNYLDNESIETLYQKSFRKELNASWIAVIDHDEALAIDGFEDRLCVDGYLIGFRLTNAAQVWQHDEWCSPSLWGVDTKDVCYFKCNTVDENVRGLGVGSTLLKKSIDIAKQQGAKAGLAHIWLASPENSAFGYFSACGGELVKKHRNKWQALSIEEDYQCPVCPALCECEAAEMILRFEQ